MTSPRTTRAQAKVVFLNINIGFDPSRETQTGSMEAIVTGSKITARSPCLDALVQSSEAAGLFSRLGSVFLREVHCSSAVIR